MVKNGLLGCKRTDMIGNQDKEFESEEGDTLAAERHETELAKIVSC